MKLKVLLQFMFCAHVTMYDLIIIFSIKLFQYGVQPA